VERVLVVQRALRIGFTLAELADVLKARDKGGVPCRRVYKIANEKLEGISTDIQALKRMEKYLKALFITGTLGFKRCLWPARAYVHDSDGWG
jgi:DNA-binding transcriptional MerR regulator